MRPNLLKLVQTSKPIRELAVFAPVYFFLSLIALRDKLFLTFSWFDGTLVSNHTLLLHFGYTNNEQSRLLQFLIPELFRNLFSLSIPDAYILQRWLFVFLAFVCFHMYLRKWFGTPASFAGVLFLAAIMPLTSLDDLQESSPLLLLTFLIGLWAIRDDNILVLLLASFVGGLNNETMLMIPVVYFFYHFKAARPRDKMNFGSDSRNVTRIVPSPLSYPTSGPGRVNGRYPAELGSANGLVGTRQRETAWRRRWNRGLARPRVVSTTP